MGDRRRHGDSPTHQVNVEQLGVKEAHGVHHHGRKQRLQQRITYGTTQCTDKNVLPLVRSIPQDLFTPPPLSRPSLRTAAFGQRTLWWLMSLELRAVPAHFSSTSLDSGPVPSTVMASSRSRFTARSHDARSPRMMI